MDDEDEEEDEKTIEPEPVIEIIDICAPSPPRVTKINEVKKSSNRKLLTIETLLCPPGRHNRPSKIVIILRGLPGSGKSHVAKLIKVCILLYFIIMLFKLLMFFFRRKK